MQATLGFPHLLLAAAVALGVPLSLGCRRRGGTKDVQAEPIEQQPIISCGSRNSIVGGVSDNDFDMCYSEARGRYKHCGLRQAILADDRAPSYSSTPPPLAMPHLTQVQEEALEELGRRVADLSGQTRTDKSTLVRYLRARKYNVEKSEKYFREAAAWRHQHGAERALDEWNLEAYEHCLAPWWLSGGFLGHGRGGEQVAWERLARCNWSRMINLIPFEELEKLDIIHCMRSLAALEEDAVRTGKPLGNGILVQDCDGFSWEQAKLWPAQVLNRLVGNRNQIMPECIKCILVVRAPPAMVYAWRMLKHIIEPGIVEKVRFATPEGTMACLREFLDDEQIPAFLGGTLTIDGDPECRKVLAPGGPMPQAAAKHFLRLAQLKRGEIKPDAPSPGASVDGGFKSCCFRVCG